MKSDRWRGNLNYNYATDAWNTRNPYSAIKAPLLLNEFENVVSGPLNKRTSLTLDAFQNNVDNGSIVNAITLNSQTLAASPFFDVFKTLQRRTRLYPRIDYQLNDNHTLSLRYSFTKGDIQGAFTDANGVIHGFVRSHAGAITTFNVPGAGTGMSQGTNATYLNDVGTVSGIYIDANYVFHGFVRSSNGTIKKFDVPGAGAGQYQGTSPTKINASGVIQWLLAWLCGCLPPCLFSHMAQKQHLMPEIFTPA